MLLLGLMETCKAVIEGQRCDRKIVAFGYCDPHYRHTRNGDPPRKIRNIRAANLTLVRDELGNKECIYCGRWKQVTEFNSGNATADKLQVFCVECGTNKKREKHLQDPDVRKRYWYLKRYGITPQTWDKIFESQGRKCQICLTHEPGKRGWHIDHCHLTLKVRGILCMNCNTLLGQAKDSVEILGRAIEYLKENHE